MSEIAAIGIDLGGTRIKGILLRDNAIEESIYKPTGAGDNFKDSILETVNELRIKSGASNVVVGISAPGIPDSENKSIAVMPGRLPGLENFIWSDFLKVPAFVLNDAVCALVAEARLGAARGLNHVVMLTLGTGVGGAMLINGSPYQGAFNKAGHWGHTSVDSEGFADVTAMPGSIEEAIGNVSIERRSLGQFKSTQELLDAVLDNDPFAQWVWLTSVQKLAVSVAGISNAVSPEAIVLGGGIAHAGEVLFTPLRRFMDIYEWRPSAQGVKILKAELSDLAGAAGAACFAIEKMSR